MCGEPDVALHKVSKPFLNDIRDNGLTIGISRFLTFTFVMLCWAVFRSPDLDTLQQLFSAIFLHMDLSYAEPFFMARTTWCMLLLASLLSLFVGEKLYHYLEAKFIYLHWLLKLLAFLIVIQTVIELHSSNIQPFLYFRF